MICVFSAAGKAFYTLRHNFQMYANIITSVGSKTLCVCKRLPLTTSFWWRSARRWRGTGSSSCWWKPSTSWALRWRRPARCASSTIAMLTPEEMAARTRRRWIHLSESSCSQHSDGWTSDLYFSKLHLFLDGVHLLRPLHPPCSVVAFSDQLFTQ